MTIFRRLCRSVHSSSVGNRTLTVFVPSAERSWTSTCRPASNTAFFCSSMIDLYGRPLLADAIGVAQRHGRENAVGRIVLGLALNRDRDQPVRVAHFGSREADLVESHRELVVGVVAFLGRFLIVPYDLRLARVWARVIAHSKATGRRLEAGDEWIAATALHRGVPLLSHGHDFVGLELAGLEVVCYARQV